MSSKKERIDKTEKIEQLLKSYMAVCLCGLPGIGRKTAVSMLLEKHPEVLPVFCSVNEVENGSVSERANSDSPIWYLVRKPEDGQYPENNTGFWNLLRKMRVKDRIFLAVDGIIPENFLEFIWNGIMAAILPETFLFSEQETKKYLKLCKSDLNYKAVQYLTGGWAGGVAVLVRLSRQLKGKWTAEELACRYEVTCYIEKNILSALPEDEKRLISKRAPFPVLNEELVSILWGNADKKIEERLFLRGAMVFVPEKKIWYVHPILRLALHDIETEATCYKAIVWYESNGYIQEALETCWRLRDMEMYRKCLIQNYDKVPFLHYQNVEQTMDFIHNPELYYLNWMEYYLKQDYRKLNKLRHKLQYVKQSAIKDLETKRQIEILLNILYTDMLIPAKEWILLLDAMVTAESPIRLYFILGESVSYLSGIRDLSELFACNRSEREKYRKIWREKISEENQIAYDIAEAEYDYYTDSMILAGAKQERHSFEDDENASWQVRLGIMHLLYLYTEEGMYQESAKRTVINIASDLQNEESDVCRWNSKALYYLAEMKWGTREKLLVWVKETEGDIQNDAGKTRFHLTAEVKINLLLGNYRKAEELLEELIPYFEKNHSYRWLAEALFQKALTENERGDKSRALKTLAQSFTVANPYRYVRIYTGYGKRGAKLLEDYFGWINSGNLNVCSRKKKYKYGNVIRMPFYEWVDYIVRKAKKEIKYYQDLRDEKDNIYNIEKLTLTEQMVLQYLQKGYTNAEICEAMNIKLSTTKTHIYNIYRKLGVSTRTQALQKARDYEML